MKKNTTSVKGSVFFFSLLMLCSLIWFGIGTFVDFLQMVSYIVIIGSWSAVCIMFIAGKIAGYFLSPFLKQLGRTPF